MKGFKSTADVLTLTAPGGGVVTGIPVVIGAFFVIPQATVAATLKFAGLAEGEVEIKKRNNFVVAEGDRIGWDTSLAEAVPDGDVLENIKVGIATKAQLSGDAVVTIKLERAF